jgi:hypothetical protein
MTSEPARLQPVCVARARVTRADGTTEVRYSVEKVPIRQFRRWWKLQKHLKFMRKEDRQWP